MGKGNSGAPRPQGYRKITRCRVLRDTRFARSSGARLLSRVPEEGRRSRSVSKGAEIDFAIALVAAEAPLLAAVGFGRRLP